VEVRLQQRIAIEDDSHVGEARRAAASFSRVAALSDTEAGRVAIIVNELGSNVRKHAEGGELILRELRSGQRAGVEVLSIDRGPGMDLESALRDGHSTTRTRGEGLGAVRRQAHEFDAFSASTGSVIVARVWGGGLRREPVEVGAVCVPMPGEEMCGDGWEVQWAPSSIRLLVVDGLGHGPIAARAATVAVEMFVASARLPGPEAVVHALHGALRPTRGAALGVAQLDLIARAIRFCGVGNVGASLEVAGHKARGLVSHNGIAGHEARRIQEFTVPWPAKGMLVMHSDGIQTQWKLDAYSGLQARHPSVIAGMLYRDFRRKSDDSTVVVIKEP
jgi:anti-sigma regulatory factor (Ser/Thr protein kinase)